MLDAVAHRRLQLFAFTQADHRQRYLDVLAAFESAREESLLQLGAADVLERVADLGSLDEALAALDQLHAWGVLERLQDDRRVRTIAEYRQRRSIYLMTELGWMAHQAVRDVLEARLGEAELRRLVLRRVHDELLALHVAVQAGDAADAADLLGSVHEALSGLADRATRFLVATNELSSTWDADPAAFIQHKGRLLSHLEGFLSALAAQRPLLGVAASAVLSVRTELVELVAASPSGLDSERARERARQRIAGIEAWFLDRGATPSQAHRLEERSTRAIRDLSGLLRRVIQATAGGVSRASRLEDLAAFFVRCPDDEVAHALAGATSGLARARHVAAPSLDDVDPTTSWWDAPPAPIDSTLRKRQRGSATAPPKPIPDRSAATLRLRARQRDDRAKEQAASGSLAASLVDCAPLDRAQTDVLLRLLSRALHGRRARDRSARTVHGRLRLSLTPSPAGSLVPTCRGILHLPEHRLTIEPSGSPQ